MRLTTLIQDILKTAIGLYVALVALWLLFRFANRLPNPVGAFFRGAQKLATPAS